MAEKAVEGIPEFIAKMTYFVAARRNLAMAAMYQRGNEIAAAAKDLSPVDLGNLRRSIRAHEPVDDGNSISVVISAGDEASEYAAIVHYDLDAHHEVGEALFLEHPFMEASGTLVADIAKKIRSMDNS